MKSLTESKAPYVIWEVKDQIRFQGERRRAEITTHLLKPQRGDLILDVGCGEGFQISYISQSSTNVVGIDLSMERLKEARKRLKRPDFLCASSESLPFKPQIFNRILCLELLEHLQDPSETLEEIEFVLKEAGTLIVSVPYKEHIVSTQCIHCGKLTPLWGHIHSFDEQKLVSLLPDSFRVVQFVHTGTVVGAYPLFSSLPTGLWKLVDDFSRVLPGVKPSWFLAQVQKVRRNSQTFSESFVSSNLAEQEEVSQ